MCLSLPTFNYWRDTLTDSALLDCARVGETGIGAPIRNDLTGWR